MSLEQALNENTAALNALIALVKAGGLNNVAGGAGKAAKGDDEGEAKSTKSTKGDDEGETKTTRSRKSNKAEETEAKSAKSSKFTAEDVKVAAVKVKDALGTKEAKRLIAEHGAEELAKLKPEVYEDFINACEAALKGDDDNGDDEDDGL